MRKIPVLIGTALLCLSLTTAHAQSIDSASVQMTHFPSRLFDHIQSKTASLDQQLDRQTTSYLRRLARQDARLKKQLYVLDSNKAAALYAQDPQQQYALLAQKLRQDSAKIFHSMGPEYLPYADSTKGVLGFLNKYPSLINANPALQGKMQASLAGLQQLQSKLQMADQIKQYVQQRQTAITQALSQYSHLPSGITGPLANYKKQAYYYAEQVRAYRQILNDPDKMMKEALVLLNKLPAFTSFMRQNSFLAGLFSVPTGYDQGAAGLQTRDQVLSIIQNQVGQGGPSGSAAIQSSLSSASQDITKMQNKLSSLGGGSGDMDMPNFKPNNQHNKRFWQRLELGTYLQTTPATTFYPTYTDMGLSVAYQLGHSNSIGVGASYKVGWGTPLQHIAFSSQGAGLRSFIDIHLKKSFSLTGGFELNYLSPFQQFQDLQVLSGWTKSGLIGVTKTVSMKSRVLKKTQVSFLWDFLSYYQTPKTQPILFRVGYGF